jgi:DNA-binding transcriptional LysR family regulator
MNRPSVNDLAAFVAVANQRSFRRAADALGVAPSTLSHSMRALEERMGVRLLNRTTRSVSPTEAGLQLLARLTPALSALDEALDSVAPFRGTVTGTVRINTPRLPATYLVREVLPRMAERYPDVSVDIVIEGRLVDIIASGFDAGVRLIGSIPRDMVAVQLGGDVEFVCVAAPSYLERYGEPLVPDDLKRHRCIGHRMPSGKLYHWEFERAGQELVIGIASAVTLDDEELMVEAAERGLGIAYVAGPAATRGLESGRLQQIFSEWVPAAEKVGIYYPGHRAVPPALRAFLDTVIEVRRARDS